jgi:hypothetical protein
VEGRRARSKEIPDRSDTRRLKDQLAAECLEVIRDSRIATGDDLARLCREGHELRLIFAKAARTANENEERAKRIKKQDGRR